MGRRYVLLVLALALAGCGTTYCSQHVAECAIAYQQGRAMTAPAPSTALPMCYEVEPYTRNVPCRQF